MLAYYYLLSYSLSLVYALIASCKTEDMAEETPVLTIQERIKALKLAGSQPTPFLRAQTINNPPANGHGSVLALGDRQ